MGRFLGGWSGTASDSRSNEQLLMFLNGWSMSWGEWCGFGSMPFGMKGPWNQLQPQARLDVVPCAKALGSSEGIGQQPKVSTILFKSSIFLLNHVLPTWPKRWILNRYVDEKKAFWSHTTSSIISYKNNGEIISLVPSKTGLDFPKIWRLTQGEHKF